MTTDQQTALAELRRLADLHVQKDLALLMKYAVRAQSPALIDLIAKMVALRVTLWTTTNDLLIAESEVTP